MIGIKRKMRTFISFSRFADPPRSNNFSNNKKRNNGCGDYPECQPDVEDGLADATIPEDSVIVAIFLIDTTLSVKMNFIVLDCIIARLIHLNPIFLVIRKLIPCNNIIIRTRNI